ncbi:toxin-activating lysine-acyltransferase [Mesorhizobium sp. CGMCC 1.15528]|uniref:RTX toxin-activating lysine-acyltransferase n=1 Tax=Mesorhizobium zhangyense TaxID=1776730 RepID=A0A7C9VFN9_9HYPH|nr:toxin-activating lysine-acyltransferase [Mesorhizobium zhangyense]NGN45007.1 toxin-activating lysine-acyltransferase [Mesorhizobium zhangyense]
MTTKKSEKKSRATVGSEKVSEPVDPVAGKSVAEIFGEIVWLMSQDKEARELSIKDLEWLVMPPILLKQFYIKYAPVPGGRTVKGELVRSVADNRNLALQPVAVELYAMCSDMVAAGLNARPQSKSKLIPSDWRSGNKKMIIYRTQLAQNLSTKT